jgi:hypothetical protein
MGESACSVEFDVSLRRTSYSIFCDVRTSRSFKNKEVAITITSFFNTSDVVCLLL